MWWIMFWAITVNCQRRFYTFKSYVAYATTTTTPNLFSMWITMHVSVSVRQAASKWIAEHGCRAFSLYYFNYCEAAFNRHNFDLPKKPILSYRTSISIAHRLELSLFSKKNDLFQNVPIFAQKTPECLRKVVKLWSKNKKNSHKVYFLQGTYFAMQKQALTNKCPRKKYFEMKFRREFYKNFQTAQRRFRLYQKLIKKTTFKGRTALMHTAQRICVSCEIVH